jgi:hypothetical protein
MDDGLDIPDFLRAEVTALLPKPQTRDGVKIRRPRHAKKHRFDLPLNVEPAGWALLKKIEAEKAEKKAARFKMLRERHKG